MNKHLAPAIAASVVVLALLSLAAAGPGIAIRTLVDAKQATLDQNSNITVSNITSKGSLKLSGQSKALTVADGALLFDGAEVGSGGETVWTNTSGVVSLPGTSTNYGLVIYPYTAQRSLTIIKNTGEGHSRINRNIFQSESTNREVVAYVTIDASVQSDTNSTAYLALNADSNSKFPGLSFSVSSEDSAANGVYYFGTGGDPLIRLLPEAASGTFYEWDTEGAAAATDKLAAYKSNGTEKLSVLGTGAPITQGGTGITPANASATGTAGTILWDANFIYIAVANNTWKRVAIATW
jgi:hypothetical protein